MSDHTPDSNLVTSGKEDAAPMGTERGHDEVVRLSSRLDTDGTPIAHATLTHDSDQRCKEILVDNRYAIPVIFLPGVMGSLLANRDTGEAVWHPPNIDRITSIIPGVLSVIADWFASAVKRATRFDPIPAVVDPRGPVDAGDSGLSEEEARRRGWSTVHRWSYQPALAWLEYTLNHPMLNGEPHGEWAHGDNKGKEAALKAVLGTAPSGYGGQGPGEPITEDSEVFKALMRYRYPVYAIGYNFLQSNEVSGQQVLDGVDFRDVDTEQITRIMGIREICRENDTSKAILITHSMGGLVARMASQFCGGACDIHGVIHGAQPATGAPLFARRFRTGGEDFIAGSLVGRNDAEFVAIASNAEGPMELAPMPDYYDGKSWWIVKDNDGNERLCLPQESALDEIYTKDAWYGLLPDSSLLDPAGIVKKRLEEQQSPLSVHEYFKQRMELVVKRHRMLLNNYHPNTYALYGDGALEASESSGDAQVQPRQEVSLPERDLLTWGRVVWQGDLPASLGDKKADEAELKAAQLIHDDHHGTLTLRVRGQTVKLRVKQIGKEPDGEDIIGGDNTVPTWSAEAQSRGNGVQMVFVQGGYKHQFCFDHPWTRWATLYSMAQIAHSIGKKTT
ncbi:esterase/lipase family protein [Paraburkholderia bonniea]|uniref:esterase/lipase family protein n=1 Tax=Paraburkholderia bonniea TaxID=2152891 RepID=UPI001FE84A6C|nr:alpha/beta hydrolase [Paraburkholderia bonniea]